MLTKKQLLSTIILSVFSGGGIDIYAQWPPMSSNEGAYISQQHLTSHPGKVISPNVTSFERIHEVNVDMFNGLPSMYHPLISAQGDDMRFDIGLSYNGGGVKVNETAGWTGLNWNLVGDYQIVRRVNDIPDERFNRFNKPFHLMLDRGYFYSAKEQLDNNNWNTTSFLSTEFDPYFWAGNSNAEKAKRLIIDAEPDEFMFNLPGGISGSFYRSEKAGPNDLNGWRVKSKDNLKIDIEHEVFADGNPTQGSYPIVLNKYGTSSTSDSIFPAPYLFTKFVITTPDGYRYTFGGKESALEVSRGVLHGPSYMIQILGFFYQQYSVNVWKLTKIEAPSGEDIKLSYERGKILFHLSKEFVNEVAQSNGNHTTAKLNYTANVTYPVYLSKVETSRQIISFKRSQAVEKWYNPLAVIGCNFMTPPGDWTGPPIADNRRFSLAVLNEDDFSDYASNYVVAGATTNPDSKLPNYNQQLDSIILFDKTTNSNVLGYKLLHSANANQRRTLDGYFKFNFDNNQFDNRYEFSYESINQLPELFSINRDFWGFPNYGAPSNDTFRCGFDGFGNMPHTFPVASSKGYLKSIKNPMGGVTELTYEPNMYHKKVKVSTVNNSVSIADITNDDMHALPGARISEIKKQDYFGAEPIIKQYKYVLNYPNTGTSSGILNFDYLEKDIIRVDRAGTLVDLYNHSTLAYQQYVNQFRGGIVNYSEVAEVSPGNGYTIYKYTNSEDPQCRDEIHCGYGNDAVIESKNFRLSSADLDRGKLKQVSYYNEDDRLQKEKVMTYENNPNRKNDFVKAISRTTLLSMGGSQNGSGNGVSNHRAWAYKIYHYKNPLKKTVEKTFNRDGTIAFTQEKTFDYDAYGSLVLSTETASDGKVISKATKYNSHADYTASSVSGQQALGLKNLNNLGIKNYPVEQLIYTDHPILQPNALSRILSGTEFTYKSDKPILDKEYALELDAPIEGIHSGSNPTGIKSSKINGSGTWEQDARFVLQKSYPEYTGQSFANKPKTILGKAENEAILWDYSGKYPVATFQNTTAAEVAYTGFEGDYNGANGEFKNGWQFNGTNFQVSAAQIGKGAIFVTPSTTKTVNNTFINSAIALQNGKKYHLAFWAPTGNGFEYYRAYNGSLLQVLPLKTGANGLGYFETEFTAQGSGNVGLLCYRNPLNGSTGQATIDEIALFPAGTLFKSASYDGASGQILSVNDGTGHLQLFEYDPFFRLIKVRDENGHLISDHQYKIQSPY